MALTKEQLDAYIQGLYDDDGNLSPEDYQKIINYIISIGEPALDERDLIQIRRGDEADLPILAQGELAFTLDTETLYVGGLAGNVNLNKSNVYFLKDFGADPTGAADSTPAFNKAILEIPLNSVLYIEDGTYSIQSEIVMNKKISLVAVGEVTLRADAAINAIISTNSFASFNYVEFKGINFDANLNANYCVLLDGSITFETVRTTMRQCSFRRALMDGVRIIPTAYLLSFNNCMFNNNERDGLRAIVETSGQINAVYIDENCIFQYNKGAGINITGTNHTINNCDFEMNEYGVKIDLSQQAGAGANICWATKIENCHFEQNSKNQVLLNSTGGSIYAQSENNYFFSNKANATDGTELVKCEGAIDTISLVSDKNFSEFTGVKLSSYIDGGNSLSKASFIGDWNIISNLGNAIVDTNILKSNVFPVTNGYGAEPSSASKTENMITATIKYIQINSSIDMCEKSLRNLLVYVETDSTDYTIDYELSEIDLTTMLSTKSTIFTSANLSGNLLINNNVVANWGYYRIPENKVIQITIFATAINGTYLRLVNPTVKYI